MTFHNILRLLKLFGSDYPEQFKLKKGLELIGVDTYEPIILDEVSKYLFNTKTTNNGEKVFDYYLDYKYYYTDFLRLGINLNNDISWWEFDTILEGLMLVDNTTIGKVLQYRTYQKPPKNYKTSEANEEKFYQKMKRQYALPQETKVDENLDRMWNYLQTKKKGVETPNE